LCASIFLFTTKGTKGHKENLEEVFTLRLFPSFVIFVSFVVKCRQNKSPFAIALGDWFSFRSYFSTSKASPNDPRIIVIVVIIIVGEAKSVLHSDGIIAQTVYLGTVFLFCEYRQPKMTEKMTPIAISRI
jgi:pheromone shutdown protein TraB